MKNKLNAKSYRMKEVMTGTGEDVGVNTSTEKSYLAPDKYYAVVEASVGGSSSGRREMFLLGRESYAKGPDGKWEKKLVDPQRAELEFARLRHEELIDSLTRAKPTAVKLLGKEKSNGSVMFVYQYSFVGPPEMPTQTRLTTWVGVEDSLPHRIEMVARTNFKGIKFSFKTTTTYYDYNTDIKIEPPM